MLQDACEYVIISRFSHEQHASCHARMALDTKTRAACRWLLGVAATCWQAVQLGQGDLAGVGTTPPDTQWSGMVAADTV